MRWKPYKGRFKVSDQGHVFNEARGTYLIPQRVSNRGAAVGYKIHIMGKKGSATKSLKMLLRELFDLEFIADGDWLKKMVAEVKSLNSKNEVNPQSKIPAPVRHDYQCEACNKTIRLKPSEKHGLIQKYDRVLCGPCRSRLNDFERPIYIADPYPFVYVQGAAGDECNGLILGLG